MDETISMGTSGTPGTPTPNENEVLNGSVVQELDSLTKELSEDEKNTKETQTQSLFCPYSLFLL
jgi:hypothetical protein